MFGERDGDAAPKGVPEEREALPGGGRRDERVQDLGREQALVVVDADWGIRVPTAEGVEDDDAVAIRGEGVAERGQTRRMASRCRGRGGSCGRAQGRIRTIRLCCGGWGSDAYPGR